MGRITSLLLSLLLLCTMAGCHPEEEMKRPVNFYYVTSELSFKLEDTVIQKEVRDCGDLANPQSQIRLYLKGPVNENLRSPFPANLELLYLSQHEQHLLINLSGELASLSGLELMLSCSCLALTCMELTGAESITIRANGASMDGQDEITLDKDSILLLDTFHPKED